MSDTIISFTTIEFPNEELMENTREIFNVEMKSITEKLKPHGMIKFHSSRLFLPLQKHHFRYCYQTVGHFKEPKLCRKSQLLERKNRYITSF